MRVVPAEIRDVADGLWVWRVAHPDWSPESDWEPLVASTCVESGGEVLLLDPIAPPDDADDVWERLEARPPTVLVVLELEPIEPGSELPGGLVALYDGRGRNETPLWLPEQRALVFSDALTAPAGELRVWATPWHEERALPALRALLELPFEHVIVSHGEPVHTRSAYERALELPPWGD
jgi:hypothetical protein